jgi:hypothetical protein
MQLLIFSYLEQGATCQVDRDRRLVKSGKTERGSRNLSRGISTIRFAEEEEPTETPQTL